MLMITNFSKYILGLLFLMMMLSKATMASEHANQTIYGLLESVTILPEGLTLGAKLDTGADSASLHALDIEEFERDGEDWVRFIVPLPNLAQATLFEKKLYRQVRIKRRPNDDSDEPLPPISRPVVKMDICINGKVREIEVNLTNRENFSTPMLLGRYAIIAFNGIVDPSIEFTASHQTCDE